jgi:hypothetical protein
MESETMKFRGEGGGEFNGSRDTAEKIFCFQGKCPQLLTGSNEINLARNPYVENARYKTSGK